VLVGDQQRDLFAQWNKVKNKEWEKVPVFLSDVDCVAKGAAILGAVSHGRILTLAQVGGGKPRAELGLRVQNVAPCAVAIRYNYHGTSSVGSGQNTANNSASQWSEAKVLFDFDRPLPAGPLAIECKAAECVVHRMTAATAASPLDEQEFIKQTKNYEGAKGIPLRETAALNFQVQLLQKWTRDGEWKPVGDILEPLVKADEDSKGKVTRVACESASLEISLGVTGLITRAMVGERYVRVFVLSFSAASWNP
jgi:hypothetical protein